MIIDWNQSGIDLAASAYVRTVLAQAQSVMDQTFVAGIEGDAIVLSPAGMAAEFGTVDQPGTPWVMDALGRIAGGDH